MSKNLEQTSGGAWRGRISRGPTPCSGALEVLDHRQTAPSHTLQHHLGNRGTQAFIEVRQIARVPQRKLAVSTLGDASEREADRIAGSVMRMPEAAVQRMCTECEEEEKVLTKAEDGMTPALPTGFEGRLAALGGGQPLSVSERAFFESRFSRDFSGVRVHSGPAAGELAQSVQARAFTLGHSIVFGAGEHLGGQLLAHELTHVVQQQATSETDVQRQPLPLSDSTRGFRPEDLARLDTAGISLTFAGSLSPIAPGDQKILLENIAETIHFALDPKHPGRVRELAELKKDFDKQGHPERFFDQPAGRLDATDLYHGHVCVPKALLHKSSNLQKLQDNPYSEHGTGPTPRDEIIKAIDVGMPTTQSQSRKVMDVVGRHQQPHLKAFSSILKALANEPTAGILYHSWETDKPRHGTQRMSSDNPVRHIFTPLATHQPTFVSENKDCAPLINFGFHVDRNGRITLFPVSDAEIVRAYEILNPPSPKTP